MGVDVAVNPLVRLVGHFGEQQATDSSPPDDRAMREALRSLQRKHAGRTSGPARQILSELVGRGLT